MSEGSQACEADLDPIRGSPYGPAASDTTGCTNRPDRRQHLTTGTEPFKEMLALSGASIDGHTTVPDRMHPPVPPSTCVNVNGGVHSRQQFIQVGATGELVAVDTFFAGTLKGVGKVYIQTVLDCFGRFVWARLHTSKMPVTAVQILNNHALPSFEEHAVKVRTILSDNGREYCGRPDRHPYELFLQLEEIEHRTTKVG